MRKKRELYRSENILIEHSESHGNGPLMILFPQLDENQSLEKIGFGVNLYSKMGRDFISIKCSNNAWLQYPETKQALSLVRELACRYPSAITYGSSMGGYCALAFARNVGATRSVAIAPQFSPDPKKVPFEKRWLAYRRSIPSFVNDSLSDNILPGKQSFIFYDPFYEQDANHVRFISACADVQLIQVPFGGHLCGELLASAGMLRDTVESIVQNNFNLSTFRRELRVRKRALPRTWRMLAERAARKGKANLATWAMQHANRSAPS
ncbi:hypothetical protein [Roseomonas sp. WA12]